ncbi:MULTISPECIES: 2Fe-2S iron-sulfur cluster-binding protein [Pseudomonas syringae group]|uniref:2Fe-2S iron-sulfur cluster-binding protein n=1 Tax=Pseudomonas syringae group TaxID=136849 RepID=UPI0006D619E2|nr:2Fe-2S iron-sulfur cluster-binding protein [Pseudomonas coronafaciens]KPX30271.1 Ferredoxin [Pseudomonas coronafaciens pv. garcae]KPZ29869.1 Ferredoxin [Pseudomonas coronafaciens pv. zizaniae]RMS91036.1 Ferredoxin [Pseudomonas coronafaciens pv. oryzae]RMS91478.1 Ferredoxin [Pseudomonas coronafaciens pv. oryzae]RMV90462.1 Ferredoxin [Pseudomonas coronafaciens pv. garcae]
MALHTLTITSHQLEFLLPVNTPVTDIEWEVGGKNVIPLGCRVGACGACLIKVKSGLDALNPRDDDEEAFIEVLGYSGAEYRLACQCQIRGNVAIEIIG